MDLTVGKTFRIGEHQSVLFRTDFLNLTNHPSFATPPAADIEHPTLDKNKIPIGVGQIASTVGNPRFIQFSLKYSF
jgi:hypothetical protein